MFRRVLCHECIGHGFAKLLDEYSYEQQGVIPASEIEKSKRMQQQLGWAMNVDFTNNRETVLWKHFLNDSRYQGKDLYGEELGVYEGACTYWRGAWRPTVESMMRSNTHGFNAPSREAIYKRIMKLAYGSSWTYDYKSFVEFDRTHLPQPVDTRTIESHSEKPFAAPRFVGEVLM
ncbi:MAG: M64 family metallopeptidase [Bacteroides sp.]|nr:M64 family metallopeptidase [Bacteroides sp.]